MNVEELTQETPCPVAHRFVTELDKLKYSRIFATAKWQKVRDRANAPGGPNELRDRRFKILSDWLHDVVLGELQPLADAFGLRDEWVDMVAAPKSRTFDAVETALTARLNSARRNLAITDADPGPPLCHYFTTARRSVASAAAFSLSPPASSFAAHRAVECLYAATEAAGAGAAAKLWRLGRDESEQWKAQYRACEAYWDAVDPLQIAWRLVNLKPVGKAGAEA